MKMKKERLVEDSGVRYHHLVNNLRTGVVIYQAVNDGEDFIFKDINKTSERVNKVRKEEILGKSVQEIFPSVTEIGLFDIFQRVYRTGKSEHLPLVLYKDQRIAEWVENFVFKLPSGEVVAIYDDLSEYKMVEEKLRKSEERLQLSLDIMDVGLWDWHIPTGKVFFSDLYFTMAGYKPGEFEANVNGFISHLHPDDVSTTQEKVDAVINDPIKPYEAEFRFKRKDGSYIWIQAKGRIVELDEGGRPARMLGTHTNITPLKNQVEAEHQKANEAIERQKILLEVSRLYDPDFQKTWESISEKTTPILNADRTSIWSFSQDKSLLICEDLFIRSSSEHSSRVELICDHYPSYLKALEKSRYVDASDGVNDPRTTEFTTHYLNPLNIKSLLDVPVRKGGQLSGVICFEYISNIYTWSLEEKEFAASLADIVSAKFESRERSRTEKELSDSENRYRNILDNANIGIFRTTANGNFLFGNPAMVSILEFDSLDDLLKSNAAQFYRSVQEREKYIIQLQKKKVLRNYEVNLVSHRGSLRICLINSFWEGEEIVGMIMDVTNQKKILEDLDEAKQRAEESDRLKTSLLANMSHELRTPMNSILGFSELLLNDAEDPDTVLYSKRIHRSGKRLMNTLQTILELADIETTKSKLDFKEVDLLKIISSVISPFQAQASEKGLYLVTEIDAQHKATGDKNLLKLVFQNLIDNAIKFTETGGVTIETSTLKVDEKDWVLIHFKDTGIGIYEKDFAPIFQEFRQASEGYNRLYEGTGLGLTLSAKMIELIGGSITVESEPGLGSVFTVWIPLSVDKPGSTEITEPPDEENQDQGVFGIHIAFELPHLLVVEDNEDNAEIVKLYLKSSYRIDRAPEGATALKMAENKQYDAVLLDMNLGIGMDGLEIASQLSALNAYKKIPIIAITGYTMSEDKEKILSGGCTHYIAKPFTKSDLVSMLSEVLNTGN